MVDFNSSLSAEFPSPDQSHRSESSSRASSLGSLLSDESHVYSANSASPISPSDDVSAHDSTLGLWARLSRIYYNSYIVPLGLLMLVLWANVPWLQAKVDAILSGMRLGCNGMETAASAMISTPHRMAGALNDQATSSVKSMLFATAKIINALLTIIEFVLVFIITRWQATLRCLVDTVLQATTRAISQNAQNITAFINARLDNAQTVLADAVSGINSQLEVAEAIINYGGGTTESLVNSVSNGINTGISFIFDQVGGNSEGGSVPQVNVSFNRVSLGNVAVALEESSWALPDDFVKFLSNLENSVPTLDSLEHRVRDIVKGLVSDLKAKVSSTFGDFADNLGILQVVPPPNSQSVSFCRDALQTSSLESAAQILKDGIVTALYVLLAVLVTMILFEAAKTYIIHRRFQAKILRLSLIARSSNSTQKDLGQAQIHSLQSPATYQILSLTSRLIPKRYVSRYKWFLYYISYPKAWVIIFTAVCAIGSIYFQVAAIQQLRKANLSVQFLQDIQTLGETAYTRISGTSVQTARYYSDRANSRLSVWENDVNRFVFGWVNDTVDFIQGGITFVTDEINTGIDSVFGEVPPIQQLAKEFVSCTLDKKLYLVNLVAEFAGDNLRISLPHFDPQKMLPEKEAMRLYLNSSLNQLSTSFRRASPRPKPWYVALFSWSSTNRISRANVSNEYPFSNNQVSSLQLNKRDDFTWGFDSSDLRLVNGTAPDLSKYGNDTFSENGSSIDNFDSAGKFDETWQLDDTKVLGPSVAGSEDGGSGDVYWKDNLAILLDEYETMLLDQAWVFWLLLFMGTSIIWLGLVAVAAQSVLIKYRQSRSRNEAKPVSENRRRTLPSLFVTTPTFPAEMSTPYTASCVLLPDSTKTLAKVNEPQIGRESLSDNCATTSGLTVQPRKLSKAQRILGPRSYSPQANDTANSILSSLEPLFNAAPKVAAGNDSALDPFSQLAATGLSDESLDSLLQGNASLQVADEYTGTVFAKTAPVFAPNVEAKALPKRPSSYNAFSDLKFESDSSSAADTCKKLGPKSTSWGTFQDMRS